MDSRRIIRIMCIAVFIILMMGDANAAMETFNMGNCNTPLGMASGEIKDSDINGTSSFTAYTQAKFGRLKVEGPGGAWCPVSMNNSTTEYMEVNLHEIHAITAVQTQGRVGLNDQGMEFTEQYRIEYHRPGMEEWVFWKNRTGGALNVGNSDPVTVVEAKLDPFIVADKIRIHPYSPNGRTICMRVEIIGCIWKSGLVSYTMQQGVIHNAELNLSDRTYDGDKQNGLLTNGLGQLADGILGVTNYRENARNMGKGYEWVGWRNDTIKITGRYVEIVFAFSEVRNFSAMQIHTNNMFTKSVRVFAHAKIFFSYGGSQFTGEPVDFTHMPDNQIEKARAVILKLHNRTGQFLRVQLYFADRWIMVSEVNFDSSLAPGNYTLEEDFITETETISATEVRTSNEGSIITKKHYDTATNPAHIMNKKLNPDDSSHAIFISILVTMALILLLAITYAAYKGGEDDELMVTPERPALPSDVLLPKNSSNGYSEEATYHEPYSYMLQRNIRGSLRDVHIGMPGGMTYHDYASTSSIGQRPMLEYRPPPPPFTFRTSNPIYESTVFAPPVPPPPEQYYASIDIDPNLTIPRAPFLKRSMKVRALTINAVCPPRSPRREQRESSGSSSPGLGESDFEDDTIFQFDTCSSFPWKFLKVLSTLGNGRFGPVHVCEVVENPPFDITNGTMVCVMALEPGCSPAVRSSFDRHVNTLSRLVNNNVAKVLGANREEEPFHLVLEHLYPGDLNQFLQSRMAESSNTEPLSGKTLSYGCLIYMATQIASAMKYLESLNYIHRDLATRNCMVGSNYLVKVYELGMGKNLYPNDYYLVEDKAAGELALPIRWMSWESVLMNKCSSKTDVWAFAVTLWEILSFAREQPFEDMSDESVIENLTQYYRCTGDHVVLANPIKCPKEIYDLMCECWRRDESDRPNFREIHLFLQRKNLGYKPEMN